MRPLTARGTPHGQGTGSTRRAWAIVATLTVLMMVNFADKAAFGLAAKPIIGEFGLTLGQYGLASSGFFLPFFLSSVVVGIVADRLRTTGIIFVIAVLWGVAQFSMLLAGGIGMIIVARLLLGAAEGPMFPLANHASYKWLTDSDRSLGSSLLTAGASLGVLLGTPMITFLIERHGWRSAFEATGLASLAVALLWLAVGREGTLPATDQARVPVTGGGDRISYLRIIMTGTFWASAFGAFAAYWSIAVGLTWTPLYFQDVVGLSLSQVAVVSVISQLFLILVGYLAQGYVIKRLLERGVSSRTARGMLGGASLLIGGIANLLMVLLPGVEAKVAMGVLTEFAFVIMAIAQTVCGEIAPANRRGGVLGILAAVYALGGVVGPAVTGSLAEGDEVPGLNTAWVLKAVLLIIAGVLAVIWIRPERDAARLAARAGPAPPPHRDRRAPDEATVAGLDHDERSGG